MNSLNSATTPATQPSGYFTFGAFAAANICFFSLVNHMATRMDVIMENPGYGRELGAQEQTFKKILLNGITFGSMFAVNACLSHLTQSELSISTIAAISAAAVACRIMTTPARARGHA